MSRRFGRNQKRRLRAELAAAESATLREYEGRMMAEAVARDTAEREQDVTELLAAFCERVGRYAIAAGQPAPYESYTDETRHLRQIHLPVHEELRPVFLISARHKQMICMEALTLLDVEVVRDFLSRDMDCRVNFGGKKLIGYGISEHAVRNMTEHELINRVMPEITIMLVREMKKAMKS